MLHRIIERLAYVITKGVAQAWFDTQKKQHLVPRERPLTSDEDALIIRNRALHAEMMEQAKRDYDPEDEGDPPSSPNVIPKGGIK